MSEESSSETPRIDILNLSMGMHLGEHSEPGDDPLELSPGTEPFMVIRPCEQDGIDFVLDIILSRTNPTMAVAMLTAARSLLIEEIKQKNSVDRLLADIFAAHETTDEATDQPGEV